MIEQTNDNLKDDIINTQDTSERLAERIWRYLRSRGPVSDFRKDILHIAEMINKLRYSPEQLTRKQHIEEYSYEKSQTEIKKLQSRLQKVEAENEKLKSELRDYEKQQYLAGSAVSDKFWKAENEKLKGELEELKVINIIEGRKIKKAEDVIKHCKAMSVNYKINGLCLENAQNALQSISEETVAFLSRPVGRNKLKGDSDE